MRNHRQTWEELDAEFREAAVKLRRALGKIKRRTKLKDLELEIEAVEGLLPSISNAVALECIWASEEGEKPK